MNDPPPLANKFRALGDPIRLDILRVLIEKQPSPLIFIAALIDREPSNAHYHLRHLMAAGIVSRVRKGSYSLFTVNQRAIKDMILQLGSYLSENKSNGKAQRDTTNPPATQNPPMG
jgi:ArsR family transcriptional regulator